MQKIGIFAKKSAASRKGLQTAQNQLVSLQASFSKFCEVFEQQKTSLEERKSGFQEESRKCSAEEARLISLSHSVVSQIQELKGELADSQSHLESAQLAQVQEERKLQSATRAHEQFNQVSVATEAEKAVNFLRSVCTPPKTSTFIFLFFWNQLIILAATKGCLWISL